MARTTPKGDAWAEIPKGSIVKEVNQAVTAGTPLVIWDPAAGKKFRLKGYAVSLTVAGSVLFKYGAANTLLLRCPSAPINTPVIDYLGAGFAPNAVNDDLKVDASATGTVTGYVYGDEDDV